MKIVILDGYTENPGDLTWEGLETLGEVILYDRTKPEVSEIVERIGNAEIVYTNKTPISEEVLKQCKNVKFIGVLATGYNVIDIEETKRRGIIVCNVPNYGTDAVAQHTMALLLEICHHVGHHSRAVMDGKWSANEDWCFWDYPIIELVGKTIGIIGFGRIGRRTAELAQAFGMNVLAYNANRNGKFELENGSYTDLNTLLEKADVISLHCPLSQETKEIINKENIKKMKDGVILLNTSRGPLVNEKDLAQALNSGKIAAAGVDVVSREPIEVDNPLLKAKNCFITPHIAWASKESRERLMNCAVDNLRQFLKGTPVNVVHS